MAATLTRFKRVVAVHFQAGENVCAHTKKVGGNLVALTTRFGLNRTDIRIVEIGPDTKLVSEVAESLPGLCILHDFAVTESSYVLIVPAVRFDVRSFVLGKSAAGCIEHLQEATEVLVIPRNGQSPTRAKGERFFVTHIENAWDDDAGIVVDAVVTATLDFYSVPDTTSVRLRVAKGCCTLIATHARSVEFPAVRSNFLRTKNRFAYFSGLSDRIGGAGCWVKVDHLTGRARRGKALPGALHLEPVFVEGGDREDDGLLVGFLALNGISYIGIVDARSMAPLCVIRAEGCNLLGLHCCFIGDALTLTH